MIGPRGGMRRGVKRRLVWATVTPCAGTVTRDLGILPWATHTASATPPERSVAAPADTSGESACPTLCAADGAGALPSWCTGHACDGRFVRDVT